MNFTTMQTFVSALAGDESNVQFTVAQINLYLNLAQKETARRLELLQKSAVFTALDTGIDNMGGIALPSDFDQELHVFWGTTPSNLLKLGRIDYANFYNDSGGGIGTATPSYYTIQNYQGFSALVSAVQGKRMLFWPYQSPAQTGIYVSLMYQSTPPDMVNTTDICVLPDVTHEAICMYALAKCKLQENDYAAFKLLMQDWNQRCMELSTLMDDADGFSYPVVRSSPTSIWPVTLDA